MDYHSVLSLLKPFYFAAVTPVVTPVFIFILVILFLISFLLAGSEVAFFSLTLKDVNMLKTRQQPSYRRIVNLLEKPKALMASLVIANCFVNIAIVIISDTLMRPWIAEMELHIVLSFLIRACIISVVLVLFAEVLPKVWATNHKIWFASTGSMVVDIFHTVFYKFSTALVSISNKIERNLDSSSSKMENVQLDYAIDLLPDHEASIEEKQLLKGVRKFGNTTVKQTMRTRLDVSGIEYDTSYRAVILKIKSLHYSRIPVYKKNLDEITGILNTKDLLPHLEKDESFDWRILLRPVFYVHEQKLIEDLLQDFRNKHIHIAVVVDEFGGTSGIITLEDIMEEIIGDIQDEFDDEESINKKLDENNYIFEGKIMINDFCRALHLAPGTFDKTRGESDSLAGLILEMAGEFPKVNEQFAANGFIFTPLEINKNRIEKVKVTLQNAGAS